MQLPKKCLHCGTLQNLDTSFELTLMGHTYKVYLCETHSNTTPKDAKILLSQKLTELDEILEKVKSMGMVALSQEEYESLKSKKDASKLVSALPKELKQRLRSSGEQSASEDIELDENVEPGLVDFRPAVTSVTPTSSTGTPSVSGSYSSHKVKREKDLKIINEKVKTEAGREVVVPKLMKSKDGTTSIKIAQTFTGSDLDKKMKIIDKASRDGDSDTLNRINYNSQGYGDDCRKCNGAGTVNVMGKSVVCTSCGGSGLI